MKKSMKNPVKDEKGSSRVYRGGSWDDVPRGLRVSYRVSSTPDRERNYLGFRLVRNNNEKSRKK